MKLSSIDSEALRIASPGRALGVGVWGREVASPGLTIEAIQAPLPSAAAGATIQHPDSCHTSCRPRIRYVMNLNTFS